MIPTQGQRQAITTAAKNVLVVACPGAGKTATIVGRAQHLIKSNSCDAADIAIVTYTNAAARVIEERLNANNPAVVLKEHCEAMVGKDKIDYKSFRDAADYCGTIRLGFTGTLHSFCLKHLSKYGQWKRGIRVLDDEEADEMLVRSAKNSGVRTTPIVVNVLKRIRANWLVEKDLNETPERIAVRDYYREQTANGEFDYNSILTTALRMLRDGTMARRGWQHLIVDEIQDSAWIDARIYEAVSATNRFFVGDPNQSIFQFRGGDVREIEKLASDKKWTVYTLEENFRSGPAICEAATKLMRNGKGMASMKLISMVK